MKRHRQDLEVLSSMNITNLLDTAFILLVAFMIVAPSMKSGIPVDLPKTENVTALEDSTDSYVITIAGKDIESHHDRLYLNSDPIAIDDLGNVMADAFAANPNMAVMIRSDKDATADTMVKVIDVVSHAGIENFNFEAEPQPKSSK